MTPPEARPGWDFTEERYGARIGSVEEWDPPDPRALTKLRSHPGDEISATPPLIRARRVGPRAPAFQVTTFIELTIFTKGAGLGVLTKTIKLGVRRQAGVRRQRVQDGERQGPPRADRRPRRIGDRDREPQEDRGDRDRPDAAEARRQGDRRRCRDRRQEQRGNGQQGRRRPRHRDRADRDQLRLRTRPAGALPSRPRRQDDAALRGGRGRRGRRLLAGTRRRPVRVRQRRAASAQLDERGAEPERHRRESFRRRGAYTPTCWSGTAPTSSAFSPTSKGAAGSPVSVGSPSARPGAILSDQSSTSRSARRSGCASRPRPSSRRRSRRTRSPAVRSSIPATRSTASPSVHH